MTFEGSDAVLNVDVADTAQEQQKGLMGVETLPEDEGMAFVFDEQSDSTFWMKDTLIPLSIAFVDDSGRVIGMRDMQPCEADPCPAYGIDQPFVLADRGEPRLVRSSRHPDRRPRRAEDECAMPDECLLCSAERVTPWLHEDDECWVAECLVCRTPMVVWRTHGLPDAELEAALLERLERIAGDRYGTGGYWIDRSGAGSPTTGTRTRARPVASSTPRATSTGRSKARAMSGLR